MKLSSATKSLAVDAVIKVPAVPSSIAEAADALINIAATGGG